MMDDDHNWTPEMEEQAFAAMVRRLQECSVFLANQANGWSEEAERAPEVWFSGLSPAVETLQALSSEIPDLTPAELSVIVDLLLDQTNGHCIANWLIDLDREAKDLVQATSGGLRLREMFDIVNEAGSSYRAAAAQRYCQEAVRVLGPFADEATAKTTTFPGIAEVF